MFWQSLASFRAHESDCKYDAEDFPVAFFIFIFIMSVAELKAIGKEYLYGAEYSSRSWQAKFGCHPSVCSAIWRLLLQSHYFMEETSPQQLLWLLFWLKVNPTWEEFESTIGVNRKTGKKWIFSILVSCYLMFTETSIVCWNSNYFSELYQINWAERGQDWVETEPVCIIDVTECPIWAGVEFEWEYYSTKSKLHSLKYELAISITTQKIIWVNGPYKGSTHDLTIARDKLTHQLGKKEKALADKAYIGDWHFITPYKPAVGEQQETFNYNHAAIRQSIERLNRRIKQFHCFVHPWRLKGPSRLTLHKYAFYFVSYITQLELIIHPLTNKNKT